MGFPTSLTARSAPKADATARPVESVVPGATDDSVTIGPVAPAREPSSTQACWRLQAGLDAARTQHQRTHDEALATWHQAESYLKHKDEVTAALDVLSARAQARSKGLFEGLLTTIVREVMPGKADRVLLSSGLRNHKRTLDVDVEINGEIENVFRDKGGAFKNLISMGLRFIVLARSMNRRFLVFDEADCWLKTDHIPAVAQMVFELSHRIGVQVIYISHHKPDCFVGRAKVINLTTDGDTIVTEVGDEPPPPALEGVVAEDENAALSAGLGLQYIRLVNFKRHESTHIPLSPHVTVIAGDVDVGKSAIVQALECVIENAGRTGVIRHGTEACEVEIGLEDQLSLSWNYRRNGTRKTLYTLTGADGTVRETFDRAKEVPSWLSDYLGMTPVGGFDLHLQRQTEPNFLIDDSMPATQRAELLSLGREAYFVQQMSVRHSENVNAHRRDSNLAKKTIVEQMNRLKTLEPLDVCTEALKRLDAERNTLIDAERDRLALADWIARCERIAQRKAALEAVVDLQTPKAPAMTDTQALDALVGKLDRLRKRQSVLASLSTLGIPTAPTLTDTEVIVRIGVRIGELQKRLAALNALPALPKAPEVVASAPLAEMLDQLGIKRAALAAHAERLAKTEAEHTRIQRERDQLIESLGGTCPTCANPLHGDHHHA